MINVEYTEAIVEVLDILENSDDEINKKIPEKLIEFWRRNKSKTYKPNLDHNKPLNEMNLKDKTKDIITMVYLNYLCNKNEKEITLDTIRENEENYQLMIREKYNPDDIFKNNTNKENETSIKASQIKVEEIYTNTEMIVKDENVSWFIKIKNKIISFIEKILKR